MKKSLLCVIWIYVWVVFFTGTAYTQIIGNPELKVPNTLHPTIEKSSSKLSADLHKLYESLLPAETRRQSATNTALPENGLNEYMQVRGDMVLVDITVKDNTKTALSELEKIGFKVSAVFGRVISGSIPIKALLQLESAASIRFAQPAYKPKHGSKPVGAAKALKVQIDNVTPVISQGDTAQRSYLAREKYKVNGKGVKVGILSDSYNNLGGADIGVRRGELPGPENPFGFIKPVEVLKEFTGNGSDEGRGMAEIVHDVAPGADLAFHTAFLGQADFAQGILRLAEAGCKVITDDIIYFAEPFFQDGIIAQAVDISKKLGVSFFSAAFNESRRSYESDYRPSNFYPFGMANGTAHNFSAPGDTPRYALPITVPTGGTSIISFQWDQPFYSAGGAGAETDMNIFVTNATGTSIFATTINNIISGDPVDVLGFVNNTTSTLFYVYLLKREGPDPSRVKFIDFGRSSSFPLTNPAIPGILAPTMVGHSKAEGAIAVAAAPFFWTPAYGLDTPRVEGFSSLAGVPHYFDKQGNRIPTVIRRKPEITSVDGANTTFFGTDIGLDTDTFPNFFGTSAAAPHAAGVAALMIEAQKLNTITPDQIKGVLSANTVDMDNPYTPGFDVGFDFSTGTGLIKADAAVQAVNFPNVYVKNLDLIPECSDDPANTRNWKVFNPNPFEVKARWVLTGYPLQTGDLILPPGESSFSTRTLYLFNRPVSNVVILEWEDNFGFSRFDIATSTSSRCNESIVLSETNSDRITESEINGKVNIAEVYPNPSTGNFRLYLSLAEQQNTGIELYSIEGKLLQKNIVRSNGIINIDASGYKPGVYILKVRQGQFNKTLKLFKK